MNNHVRVLLCTLDNILWPNHGWERVGMDKLSDPQQVKKYYRKATMLCHPDKIGESDADKVYIANRGFAALTEAYNVFKVRDES
jgi:curved DNA-binding protein CbpA